MEVGEEAGMGVDRKEGGALGSSLALSYFWCAKTLNRENFRNHFKELLF